MEKISHIVCLGGGNAMPKAVLEGLKKHPVKISAISAMLDSGGFAGQERKIFATKVSFGDIRRAALALSEAPKEKKEIFATRFENGTVLANTYCTNIACSLGVQELAEELREDLNIPANRQVLPVTIDEAQLCAFLENGAVIRGETNIDVPKHNADLKIARVFLEPEARAYKPALKAIQEADLIVIGPGDLYSSLLQILLVKGVVEAIRRSRAKKVYVCNLMTKRGETNNFSVQDFASEIEKYLDGKADYVVFNSKKLSPQRIAGFRKEHPECLEPVKFSEDLEKYKFIGDDLMLDKGSLAHDPDKLAKIILDLCPNPLLKR